MTRTSFSSKCHFLDDVHWKHSSLRTSKFNCSKASDLSDTLDGCSLAFQRQSLAGHVSLQSLCLISADGVYP